MNLKFEVIADGIKKKLEEMIKRVDDSKTAEAWLNRVAYPMLVKVQRERWQTENSSQGSRWKALEPTYATRKLKRFADYPGAGTKMLIATSRLVKSMTGDDKSEHFKLVEKRSIQMGSFVPYARYVNESRDIVGLSRETVDMFSREYKKYLSVQE